MRKGRSPLRIVNRHTVTLKATGDQLARWEDAGRTYKRDVPAFVTFAADWFVRYLRESLRERSRPDPVLFRREEKRLLEALVRTAKDAARYLPQKPAGSLRSRKWGVVNDSPGQRRAVRALEDRGRVGELPIRRGLARRGC